MKRQYFPGFRNQLKLFFGYHKMIVMVKRYYYILVCFFIISCAQVPKDEIDTGIWRGILSTQGQYLPFNFEVTPNEKGFFVKLINDSEKLDAGQIEWDDDSITIPMGYFDASIKARWDGSSLKGYYTKHFADNYFIAFEASPGQDFRFEKEIQVDVPLFSGKWEVEFFDPEEGKKTPSIGIFSQTGSRLSGTFLTPTGDYRYLQGDVKDSTLNLSTFDGEHIYLFKADLDNEGILNGKYFSGLTGYKTWTAHRNENARLPDADEITYLKDGYNKISFRFPDLKGDTVSLQDEKFKGKVVIVQIFGSWCPNCMDETKFLSKWYDENRSRGVEVIGLAYENKPDFTYASGRVKKMVEKLEVHYDFLIAGSRDNAKASATLPMLNRVTAFPTTIFIDKEGKVRRIHTGFSGPGTGEYYTRLIKDFNQTIDQLLSEENTAE